MPRRMLPLVLLGLAALLPACSESSSPAPADAEAPAGESPRRPRPETPPPLSAEVAPPVAVRWWGHSMLSVETWWNEPVVLDPTNPQFGYPDPGISADVVILTCDDLDHIYTQMIGGVAKAVPTFNVSGYPVRQNFWIARVANEGIGQIVDPDDLTEETAARSIAVRSIDSWARKKQDKTLEPASLVVLEADGVRIVHAGDTGQRGLRVEQLQRIGGPIDVLCVPIGGIWSLDGPGAVELITQLKPRYVIPLHFRTEVTPEKIELYGLDQFLEALPETWTTRTIDGNTLAVAPGPFGAPPEVLVMRWTPWEMPMELAELFERKESAAAAAMDVFRPLTATQMNHRPSDGSHTPRWNAEHTMGNELRALTSVYHEIDPTIPVIDLAPAQMPEDYVAAHPDWDGAEEARQIERAQRLVRRFAYVLEGLDLDEQPPGADTTLRGLLERHARHYEEHTANVKKKFLLDDWPQE